MTIVDNFFQVNTYDALPNSLSEEMAMDKEMKAPDPEWIMAILKE